MGTHELRPRAALWGPTLPSPEHLIYCFAARLTKRRTRGQRTRFARACRQQVSPGSESVPRESHADATRGWRGVVQPGHGPLVLPGAR